MALENVGRAADDLDAGLAEAFAHVGQRENTVDFLPSLATTSLGVAAGATRPNQTETR